MESYTAFNIKAKDKIGYVYLKAVIKNVFDNDDQWPVSEYNEDEFTFEFEEAYGTGVDEVMELAITLVDFLGKQLKRIDPNLTVPAFIIDGIANYGGEEEAYLIEYGDGNLTIAETPNYVHYGSGYFSDYDDFCNECGDILDEDEFDSDFEINVYKNQAYVYEYPPYQEKINAKNYRMHNVITSADEDIVAYFEENNIPYDEDKLNNLTIYDVMKIMNGEY